MPTVTFLRHAQSEFNAGLNTFDSKITDIGKRQAAMLNDEYELVIKSPLRRCLDTLVNSNIKYKHVITSDLCREYKDNIDILCNYMQGESLEVESMEDLYNRIEEFRLLLLAELKRYKTILVISHYVFINHMIGHCLNNCQEYSIDIDVVE